MHKRAVAPSVLSMDYSDTGASLDMLENSQADWLHFDVMDGHFVPNLTFGPDILKGMRKKFSGVLDVHLMTTDPARWVGPFRKAGADLITFHTEALNNDPDAVNALLEEIRSQGLRAGFSVKPGTPIEGFASCLPHADLVLVMSVEPGFGGQSFMEDQLDKVRWLADQRNSRDLDYRIEIDGGINENTWPQAVQAGVDTLVAGSWLFSGNLESKTTAMLHE
ncbi:ribulose-phosphate 3-epimerase [uncultured Faecalibaculum sp.]|uniref:ribulose-phosphate 3-epimerase n=1 Tax=uncultured Faecalibaculum sp. TaxID=1729681 RepID=UPI00260AD062|nr:ribulose-phosphate 3-epimerase [uncultured Faecalibaculum sp.]